MRLKFAGLRYGHWALAALIAGVAGTGPEVLSRHTGWPIIPLRTGQAPEGAEEGGSSRKASISVLLVLDKREKEVREQQLGGDFATTTITAAIKRKQSEGKSIVSSDGRVLCWVGGQPSVQEFVYQQHSLLVGYLATDLVCNC